MMSYENFPEYAVPGAKQVSFSPYESNGGYVLNKTINFRLE